MSNPTIKNFYMSIPTMLNFSLDSVAINTEFQCIKPDPTELLVKPSILFFSVSNPTSNNFYLSFTKTVHKEFQCIKPEHREFLNSKVKHTFPLSVKQDQKELLFVNPDHVEILFDKICSYIISMHQTRP